MRDPKPQQPELTRPARPNTDNSFTNPELRNIKEPLPTLINLDLPLLTLIDLDLNVRPQPFQPTHHPWTNSNPPKLPPPPPIGSANTLVILLFNPDQV